MKLRLLLVILLLPCQHLNAMLGNGTCAALSPYHSGTQLVHRAVATHPITGKVQSDNRELLKKEPLISDHKRYQQEAAMTLQYVAQGLAQENCSIDRTQAVDLINYLITKIDPADIKNPETLLVAAAENNNPALFEYIEKTFGAACTAKAIQKAIADGQHENVEKLLDVSVNIKSVRPALVYTALGSFSRDDTAATTAQRLATLKTVLNRAEIKDVPTQFELNFGSIPVNVQDDIKRLLGERLCPRRLCMSKDTETPLHHAATKKDYKAAVTQLVSWSGPLQQVEFWPTQATQTFEKWAEKKNPAPEYETAIQRISAFTVGANKFIQERMRAMQEQKRALNCEGKTAYDIARATHAPQRLLDLLNPNDDTTIKPLLLKDVERRTEIPLYPGRPSAQIQLPKKDMQTSDPNRPVFGEEIIIDGVVYKATEVKKVK